MKREDQFGIKKPKISTKLTLAAKQLRETFVEQFELLKANGSLKNEWCFALCSHETKFGLSACNQHFQKTYYNLPDFKFDDKNKPKTAKELMQLMQYVIYELYEEGYFSNIPDLDKGLGIDTLVWLNNSDKYINEFVLFAFSDEKKIMDFGEFTAFHLNTIYSAVSESDLNDIQSEKISAMDIAEKTRSKDFLYLKAIDLLIDIFEGHNILLESGKYIKNKAGKKIDIDDVFDTPEGAEIPINNIAYLTSEQVKQSAEELNKYTKKIFKSKFDAEAARETADENMMEIEEMSDNEIYECMWTEITALKKYFKKAAAQNKCLFIWANTE